MYSSNYSQTKLIIKVLFMCLQIRYQENRGEGSINGKGEELKKG